VIWVIEYLGPPSCWIAETKGTSMTFDVTFQRRLARRFANVEAASDEMRRLGLSVNWFAAQIGEVN
jgi:hypothetical protein